MISVMFWKLKRLFSGNHSSVQPGAGALFQRGNDHVSQQQWGLALECFREATRLDPRHAEAHAYLGNVLRQQGELDAAVLAYDKALAIKPDYAEVHYNRGTILQQTHQLRSALESFDTALAINDALMQAHRRRGDVLWEMGELQMAEASYQRAIALMPDNVELHASRGALQMAMGSLQDAVRSFDVAVGLKPDLARVYSNRAHAQAQMGLLDEAFASHDQAVLLDPRDAQIHFNRGSLLTDLRDWRGAEQSYQVAIALKPDYADAYCNLGLSQQEMGQVDVALASYARALALNPREATVYNNRANLFRSKKLFAEARSDYREALALDPDHAEAHFNNGQLALLQGNFSVGWPEYEWRRQIEEAKAYAQRTRPEPAWHGGLSLQDKRILLHSEQGLGDTIQFCRYAGMVAALGADVALEVPPALRELLADLDGVSELVVAGATLPLVDYQCSLMSLPGAFRTTLETIPAVVPYIHADPPRITRWQEMLGARNRPRVGLAWSGNPMQRNDHNRSMTLSQLLDHLPSEFEYYSVQKEIREADKETLRLNPSINLCGPYLETFADTAALLQTLDLVVSVDTSIAHLSGALGKPTWVLLCFLPDWRWLLDRRDCPWYPTATLYRQPAVGDWDSVMSEVKADLFAWDQTYVPRSPT
jgi:tetratricopeptide (TPR) repeat protein